ncbi:MAG: polyprenol monophosphomannose synthase [candidate division WOR-3 bacterium]
MKILVIVPTYNERENILHFLDAVIDKGVDVLVVDDGSPDGTAALVKIHPLLGKRVNILERPKKLGLGSAYVEGFRWALAMGYDLIFEMDADFSHDPSDIPRMIDMAKQYDLVIGSRYIAGANVVNWPLRRLLLSYFANLYARTMVRMWDIKDLTGGFKCYRRRVLEAMPLDRIESDGYGFQIETNFLARQKGFSIVEIPIVFTERRAGMSKMSKKIMWEAFWLVWRLGFRKTFRCPDL